MATANGTAAAMHTVAATCIGTASGSNPGVEQGVGSAAAAAALQLLQEFLQVRCVGGSWIHSAAAVAQRALMVNKHT